jgi:predicted Zn-dependent peptidase
MIAALALLVPAYGQEIPFEQYKLDNGLTVVFHVDKSLPQVVVNTWYKVGSGDEVAHRSGFAHLFEHLMFMGTDRLPGNGIDVTMETNGGWNNAFTFEDGTNYYDVGPSNLVGTFLWIEADRMQALGVSMTQEKLDLQREVVRNERRQNYEDRPYGRIEHAYPAMLFPAGHPYDHSAIGSHEDLVAASVGDVKDFFATWYVPNNAILVVAGDFDPAAVKATIASYFGGIPSRALPARVLPPAPTVPVELAREVPDHVDVPQLDLYWHSAAALSDDDARLSLVADLLGAGESSRLYQKLVVTGKAQDLTVLQYGLGRAGFFQIQATAMEGVSVDELRGIIDAELASLAAQGPTEAEMERLRNQKEFGTLAGLQALQDRALTLAQYAAYTGDPGWLAKDLARFRAAKAADLQAVTKKYLTGGTPAKIVVVPEASEAK